MYNPQSKIIMSRINKMWDKNELMKNNITNIFQIDINVPLLRKHTGLKGLIITSGKTYAELKNEIINLLSEDLTEQDLFRAFYKLYYYRNNTFQEPNGEISLKLQFIMSRMKGEIPGLKAIEKSISGR